MSSGSGGGRERRDKARQPNPPCPSCRAKDENISVTMRTGHLLYLKCAACGRVWQIEKPAPRGRRRWD